jgi:DNA-binding response OmpR family regulator
MTAKHEIPVIIAQSGPVAGQRWPLNKDTLTIGRGVECDIMIPDRQVSRVHACLRRGENGFEVEDLGSKNGTHVNGAPLQGAQPLQDGDLIQVALVAKLMYVGFDSTVPLKVDARRALTGPLAAGRLRLDSAARRVWVSDQEVDPSLSVPQFRFLEMLYQNPGQVCTREQVIEAVWPEAAGAGISEQAIDALVRRLRDRLAEIDPTHQYVATVRGHGFRLDNPPKAPGG